MANFTELDQFDEYIYQIDTQDPVLGGPDGTSNKQGKALANRTNWLKLRLAELTTAFNNFTQYVAQSFAQVYTKSEVYTKAETENRIASLVNSAPSTLDTLKELSDALGSDPNFATTVLNKFTQEANARANLLTKEVQIGNWGMQNASNKLINLGIDMSKFVGIEDIVIYNNSNTYACSLMIGVNSTPSGCWEIINNQFYVSAFSNNKFDNDSWGGLGEPINHNRGTIIIKYRP